MIVIRPKYLNTFLLFFIFTANINAAEICTPVIKPTRYSIQSGEDLYSILKNFKLEPVSGSGGSLEVLQKINNMAQQTTAEPGTEVIIPFKCEEQLIGWRTINKGSYRLITSERIDKDTAKDLSINTETLGADEKTIDILNDQMPGDAAADAKEGETSEDISEALRYRMICEGEWTGTECITRYSTLFILGSAWYNRYDGTDRTTGGQGVLLSKLNPEIAFGWNNYWTENFRTELQFSIINNALQPEARERPISQDKKILNTFSAGIRYEVSKWGYKIGIEQRERLFYRFFAENIVLFEDGGVTVNAIPLVDLHASVSYMFHQAGKFRFDGAVGLVSILPGSTSGFEVNPGTAYNISGTVQHDRVQEYLFGTVKYEMSQQDTTIELQKAAELGFTFGYAWKLKDW